MSDLRVLHISDLHAREETAPDQTEVIGKLLHDVEQARRERPFDLVVFSGDLANSGAKEEYELAQSMLLEPLEATTQVPRSNIFLVPGNHDIDRDLVDVDAEVGWKALASSAMVNELLGAKPRRERATARLRRWAAFEKAYYEGVSREMSPTLGWRRSLEVRGSTIDVVCLNSAWRASGRSGDHGHMLIGDRQSQWGLAPPAEDTKQDLLLVVVHHPSDWLATFDADDFRKRLGGRPVIVLNGHLHSPETANHHGPRGGVLHNQSGCLYEQGNSRRGFAIIDVDLSTMNAVFSFRAWSNNGNGFDLDIEAAPGGTASLPIVLGSAPAPALPPLSHIQALLASLVFDHSVVADQFPMLQPTSVDDLLVPPRFFGIPFRDAQAAARVDDGPPTEELDAVAALRRTRVMIVNGDEQSGVSDALLWLQDRICDEDGGVVPINVAFPPRPRRDSLSREVDRRATEVLGHVGTSPLVIAFDDATSRAIERHNLVGYVQQHPGNTYLIGCHGEEWREISAGFESASVEVAHAFLGPFGRKQLRGLIARYTGGNDRQLMSKAGQLIRMGGLPRTPFIMATLIAVLLRQSDVVRINESGLLDAHADFLLRMEPGGLIDDQLMDPTLREGVLAWLAERLVREGKDRLPRTDVESALGDQFGRLGWGRASSPGTVLTALVARRILLADSFGIGFRHRGVRDLFAAKRMRSTETFREWVLADPLKNASIIGHAAGLPRDDRELLGQVGELVRRIFQDRASGIDAAMFDQVRDKPGWSEDLPSIDNLQRLLDAADYVEQLPEDEFDEALDEIDDQHEADQEDDRMPTPLEELFTATGLLSYVLRSSELVEDVELKLEMYKLALDCWSRAGFAWVFVEDRTHSLRDLLEQEGPEVFDEAVVDRIARLTEMIVIFILNVTASSSLGTVHLELVMRRALDEEALMADASNALLATYIYADLRFEGWVARVAELWKRHGDHPVVAKMIEVMLVTSYRLDTKLSRPTVKEIEDFLVEMYGETMGASLNQRELAAKKSDLRQQLQFKRIAIAPTAGEGRFDALDTDRGEG